ncbi:hypothetical protein BSKO_09954 [Bryopsis sp. KO-2023]|nr:hypothetical protein BSKO_09954 [Bryopsis sp. KO-2023]
MASTNAFSSLEGLGGLDRTASNKEILQQLDRAQEEKKGTATSLPETPLAAVGKFSRSESDDLRGEGWSMVSHRPTRKQPLHKVSTETSVETAGGVVPRSLPASIPTRQTPIVPDASLVPDAPIVPDAPVVPHAPSRSRNWRLLAWSALAVVGGFTLTKVYSRR